MGTVAPAAVIESPDLVVTAVPSETRIRAPQIIADEAFLAERQPRNVAEALRYLPGVSAKTNSRGETIARVRGAEERQTQVFLDGAPLAVSWDGRVDLGVLPAGLVDSLTVAKGAVPIEYGTNVVAGAIDLRTAFREDPGAEGLAQVGDYGFATASIVGGTKIGGLNLLFAAAGVTRDAERLADREAAPFSQPRRERRTNTDLDSLSLYGAIGYEGTGYAARAGLLRVATRRGIAPESDRDPAVTAPRYWRYPDIDTTQLTLSGSADLAEDLSIRAVGWRQWFSQTIVQYGSATYASRRTQQDDEDDMAGARATLSWAAAPFALRLTGSAQTSRHAQVDTNLVTGVPGARLIYRQNLYTLAAEADAPVGPVRATVGIAYDRATTPRTGDKPPQPGMDAIAFSAALKADLGAGVSLTLSGGRRTRFPSPRELFGEALGRFLINTGLKPETAWLADTELAWHSDDARVVLNPFYIRGRGTLGQRVVRVNGASLRQRYNLSGTRSYGFDAQATAELTPSFGVELFGTVQRARADPGDAAFRQLPQRPDYEVGGALRYRPAAPVLLRAEYRRVGPAADIAPSGAKARLPAGDEVNLRMQWRLANVGGQSLSLTAAVDNLTDEVILPQLGLPLGGRAVRVGFRFE